MGNNKLPVVPKPGSVINAAKVAEIENGIASAIMAIDDVDVLEEWRARAKALEAYLRGKDLQRPMLGAQRRVEARIGQLLGKPIKGKRELVYEQVPDDRTRHDFRILARGFDGKAKLTEGEWRKSRRALVALLRKRLGLMPKMAKLPTGIFRCIVADPPWTLDTGPDVFGGTGESGHDELAYPQMSLEAIKQLPVEDRAADDAHLYLWTTNKYVEHVYSVARAWGFTPSVLLVWAKPPRGVGLGDAFRLTTEFVLYARRGHLKETQIVPTTWFNWPRGQHSAKPQDFYKLVEATTPAHGKEDRLELFARSGRDGWTVWGDEVIG